MERSDAELSILITDDKEITRLNKQYLDRDGPTNVIAFPMNADSFPEITPDLLGDVVISVDTASREARESGIPLEKRFTELMVHGILHLLGYDHETSPGQAGKMTRKSRELLALIESLQK